MTDFPMILIYLLNMNIFHRKTKSVNCRDPPGVRPPLRRSSRRVATPMVAIVSPKVQGRTTREIRANRRRNRGESAGEFAEGVFFT
jgi:hypothetical protein